MCDRFVFILFNTSGGIYSLPKESKYTVVFMSINNETGSVPLLFIIEIYYMCALSFTLGKLSTEKTPLNLGW